MIYFQIIEHVTFIRPIISPQATVSSLNGLPALQYFLLYDQTTSSKSEKTHLFLNFKAKVNITANLLTNLKFQLQKFVLNTYNRLENAKIILTAKLTFERTVVNSYESQSFNLTNYMRRANSVLDHEAKQFTQNMYLHGDLVLPNNSENMSKIYQLNNYIDFSDVLSTIFLVADRGANHQNVIISENNFKAIVMSIKNIEQKYVKLKISDTQSVFHSILNVVEHQIQSLMIDGDVRFSNKTAIFQIQNKFVHMLNQIEIHNFFNTIVVKSQPNAKKTIEVAGSKTFISEMNISFAHTNEFNKQIQVRDWFSNALRQQRTEKRAEQVMKNSGWQLINTISDNFEVEQIVNGISFSVGNQSSNAMFNQFQTITVSSDISFSSVVKINNKFKSNQLRPCKVQSLSLNTLHLSQSTWDKLGIIGDVKLLKAEQKQGDTLNFLGGALISNADSIVGTDIIFQTITEKILKRVSKESSNRPNTVLVNGINFVEMFNDALLLHNESKHKLASFHCEKHLIAKETFSSGSENFAFGSIVVQLINNVDLKRLDGSIFVGNSYDIYATRRQRILFLHSIETQSVYINRNETVNGVGFEDVYFIYPEISSLRPTISFENFQNLNNQIPIVADLMIDVKSINGFDWNYFIENRFKLKNQLQEVYELFDGYLTFENLILSGDKIKIDQINEVVYDDIVFKILVENQEITGNKQMSLLQIKKPCHAWKVNNFELVSMYARTVLQNHMQVIDKLVIEYPFHLKSISIRVK